MAKILLIDDDPDVRTLLSKMLGKEGFDVETAGGREEALQKIAAENPSLILLDVLLSGTDGREVCRELKTGEQTKHIPVIMFSGHPGAAQNYESWGADDFMGKPFDTEMRLLKLNRHIEVQK